MNTNAKQSKTQAENFIKQGLDNLTKNVDNVSTFAKDNFEAAVQSANVAAKGAEEIVAEILACSRKNIEEGVAAAKDAASIRSVEQLITLQTQLSKQYFETYVEQATKLGDLFIATSKNAIEPLNARFSAFSELFGKKAA